MKILSAVLVSVVVIGLLIAQQQPAASPSVSIEEYEPKSTLVVTEHHPTRAKYPFIDVHNHQRDVSPKHLAELIKDMDGLNMKILINSPVNGSWGDKTKQLIDGFKGYTKTASPP